LEMQYWNFITQLAIMQLWTVATLSANILMLNYIWNDNKSDIWCQKLSHVND
jgi:hypothetical protein